MNACRMPFNAARATIEFRDGSNAVSAAILLSTDQLLILIFVLVQTSSPFHSKGILYFLHCTRFNELPEIADTSSRRVKGGLLYAV
jgi:hypothetical protein